MPIEIRVDLKRRGAQLGAADLMLAAPARAIGAIIVTSNGKDFGRVKGRQWVGSDRRPSSEQSPLTERNVP